MTTPGAFRPNVSIRLAIARATEKQKIMVAAVMHEYVEAAATELWRVIALRFPQYVNEPSILRAYVKQHADELAKECELPFGVHAGKKLGCWSDCTDGMVPGRAVVDRLLQKWDGKKCEALDNAEKALSELFRSLPVYDDRLHYAKLYFVAAGHKTEEMWMTKEEYEKIVPHLALLVFLGQVSEVDIVPEHYDASKSAAVEEEK